MKSPQVEIATLSLLEVENQIKELGREYHQACKPFDFKVQGLETTALEYLTRKTALKSQLSALKKRRREILKGE